MLTKMQIAVLNISMFTYELGFERAYDIVPLRRKQKIDQLKNEKDKARGLAAEFVLNYCLMEYKDKENIEENCIKNLSESDIEKSINDKSAFSYEMEYQYGGKPMLTGINPICFNLSHAGDYAVCAVSNVPVGIDIEGRHQINEKVMKKCFSEKEKNWVNENEEKKQERFFRLWTAKEAVSKATGKGLSQIIEGIYFQVGDTLVLENEDLKSVYNICEVDNLRDEKYYITTAIKQSEK